MNEDMLMPGDVIFVSPQPDPVAIARAQVFAIVWGLSTGEEPTRDASWAAEEFDRELKAAMVQPQERVKT